MLDLYSRWKDEVLSVAGGCEQAFRVIKEPLAGSSFIGPYYFIMNDWQIRPVNSAHELIVDGTLVQDASSSVSPFKLDNLTSTVAIVRQVAVEVQVLETGVSGLTSSESNILTNLENKTDRVDGLIEDNGGDRFTAKALEQGPTGGGGTNVNVVAVGGNPVTHPDDFKADLTGLATQLSVDNLNNLSTTDIDARLVAYGIPTLAQMTSAFTEIKGAGWTATDSLEAIRDAIDALGGGSDLTAEDVWTYATRTVTGGTIDTNNDMRGTDGANTVAPDNTGVADIKAKTDNLPDEPASKSDVFGASVL